jgi:phospholipid/cholesterol/gamma-HCH transport system substrate-binding protein
MTATVNFDLTELLCRYAIEGVTGALIEIDPEAPSPPAPQECGTESGTAAGATSPGGGENRAAASGFTVPGLSDGIAPLLGEGDSRGLAGFPAVEVPTP